MVDIITINKLKAVISDLKIDAYDGMTLTRLFTNLFDGFGFLYYLNKAEDGYELSETTTYDTLTEDDDNVVEMYPTTKNISEAIDGVIFQIHENCRYIIGDRIIFKIDGLSTPPTGSIASITLVTDRTDLDEICGIICKSIVAKKNINDENSYRIAYRGQYGIETTICKFNDWESDISKNYNDDIPYNEMNDVIRKDEAGLIMMYGKPGTGKTSLIKSLINDNRETNFIFVDMSVCQSISDGHFLDFLKTNKNAVIVFEDCERLLVSRKHAENSSLGTILNLTDGIIAESMKIKFICTFNCELSSVDEALLRKGRLSLKYEFKELSLEKTKEIYPEATKPMTLAEAYNVDVKNDYSEDNGRKIGFV